jgi:hypothetical protein
MPPRFSFNTDLTSSVNAPLHYNCFLGLRVNTRQSKGRLGQPTGSLASNVLLLPTGIPSQKVFVWGVHSAYSSSFSNLYFFSCVFLWNPLLGLWLMLGEKISLHYCVVWNLMVLGSPPQYVCCPHCVRCPFLFSWNRWQILVLEPEKRTGGGGILHCFSCLELV